MKIPPSLRGPRPSCVVLAVVLGAALSAPAGAAPCTGCAKPSFPAPRLFTMPPSASIGGLAIADFDEDGYPDVAITSPFDSTIALIRGPGGANSATSVVSTMPYPLYGIAAADFDRDGHVDIVGLIGNAFVLYRGDGSGGFAPLAPVVLAGGGPYTVAAGDFDGDGNADVAVLTGSGLEIYPGDGTGGFAAVRALSIGPGGPYLVVADFIPDGIDDLAFVAGSVVYVVAGSPTRSFSAVSSFPVGVNNVFIAAGDMNGDAIPDLVVTGGNGGVFVHLGNGNGTFTDAASAPNEWGSIAVGDFDGDGNLDVASGYDGDLRLLRGNGTGGLMASTVVPGLLHGSFLYSADVNRDGAADLLSIGVSVSPTNLVLLLSRDGHLDIPAIYAPSSFYPQRVAVGDVNGDGRRDIAISHFAGVDFLISNATGGFLKGTSISTFTDGGAVRIGDLDKDGKADLVVANPAYGQVAVFLGTGGGSFSSPVTYSTGSYPADLALADMNGDGSLDVVVANQGGNSVSVFLGNGNGTLQPPISYGASFPNSIAIADLDADGHPDVALAGANGLTILWGDGAGGFSAFMILPAGSNAVSVLIADFNHDGHPDLAAMSPPDGTISVFLRTGTRSFTRVITSLGSSLPEGYGTQIAAGDFNQDGDSDLALIGGQGIEILSNLNDATFARGPRYAAAATFVFAGDVDGDGRTDVVTANEYAQSISILRNTNCAARHLRVEQEPSACVPAGPPFSVQPRIAVVDDGGNVVACDTGTVTASRVAGTGTPGAVLTGSTSVGAVAGVATYANLALSADGVGYELDFLHALASNVRTRPFTLGAPPAPPVAGHTNPVCIGDTLQLTASAVPGAIYRWTGPNGFTSSRRAPTIAGVTAANAGTYSVTVTVNGCSSAAATTTVAVSALPSAAITAASSICARSTDNSASTTNAGPGATYLWTVQNGLIVAGQGTPSMTFRAGAAGPLVLSVTVTNAAGCSATGSTTLAVTACAAGYHTLAPCRLVDTRGAAGPQGGPALSAGSGRVFPVTGVCGVPATATSIAATVVAVAPTAGGNLVGYPAGTAPPLVSTINYRAGRNRANNAVLALGAAGDLRIDCSQGGGSTHLVLDVSGYFQ